MTKQISNGVNKIIIGIIALLLLGGITWIARPNSQGNATVSPARSDALVVEDANNYDFGTISMAEGKVKNAFKIINTSNEAVIINKMYTSCMCTTATLTK